MACPSFLTDLPAWPLIRQRRLYGKALVSFINVVPEPEGLARRVFPDYARVKTTNVLNRIGYLRPRCSTESCPRCGGPGLERLCALRGIPNLRPEIGTNELGGQAFLPDKRGSC
jgi:hypothetical protein